MTAKTPILVTMGEPAGIGSDCFLSLALEKPELVSQCVWIGDATLLQTRMLELGIALDLIILQRLTDYRANLKKNAIQLLNPTMETNIPCQAGVLNQAHAKAVIAAIDYAVMACMERQACAMVTAPIHKAILKADGFGFSGHTDYIAKLTGAAHPLMLLLAPNLHPALRVIPLTVHIPLNQVKQKLKQLDLYRLIHQAHASMQQDFGFETPNIALAGINPHAGEDGYLGKEEIELYQPVIQRLRQDGVMISNPLPADSLFHNQARTAYDLVLCAYHDQALIPIKTLDFYGGVNVTLGLPIIRTSPDHGTALSLAGKGNANFQSLANAIDMAAHITKKRAKHTSADHQDGRR